jgi:low affinity Fe/Cu permease
MAHASAAARCELKQRFRTCANRIADGVGSPGAFAAGVFVVVIWAVTGPLFRYSDTWQLVINTGTSVVTFLMVFLIQNTQNRDTQAMQLKLNELIRAVSTARNTLLDLENCTEDEIEAMQKEFAAIREKMAARRQLR